MCPQVLSGTGTLHVKWEAKLNDNLCGFYRSKYTDQEGKERWMAVTQFEATDARRAIPCWDEPARKATFGVSMTVPRDRDCISNMPVLEQRTRAGSRVEYVFDRTPVMSTYLLAFIVGEFDFTSTRSANGVLTTVYTPRGKSALGAHALGVASKALTFFEEQFGSSYPLPKSDLLAIPDFAAGASVRHG